MVLSGRATCQGMLPPSMPRRALVICYALVVAAALGASLWYQLSRLEKEPTLTAAGPRVVSNATDYPIQLWGDRLYPGMHLEIGKPAGLTVPTVFLDEHHLAAVIPAGTKMSPGTLEVHVSLRLFGGDGRQAKGGPGLVIVNDVGFETPYALELSADGKDAFVASPSTDEVWAVHRDGRAMEAVPVGDGPRALARFRNEIVVAHEHAGELRLLDAADPRRQRRIPIPGGAQDLAVDEAASLAYVTDHRLDVVHVVDLAAGKLVRDLPAGVNPRGVALAGTRLVVSNMGSGDVSIVDLATGTESRAQPMPGIPIIGGHTAEFSKYVMAGKAQRAVAWSPSLKVAFAASIGPDIGPNPQRMEVSMNGGIGVVSLDPPAFVRHVSIRQGVPEALAEDDARGLLYAADIATGRVVVLDARKLAASDEAAAGAILGSVALPPPDGIPLIRPRADFGVEGRPGIELHTGPKALRLADGGNTLVVLCRLTGQVVEVDVSGAPQGSLRVTKSHPTRDLFAQKTRRLGEIAYFSDLGNSSMSCDACHVEGHNDGILFEKTHPLRIYRVPTLRDARETPPYFFPTKLVSLEQTAQIVTGRNRYHNPDPTRDEVNALAAYQEGLVAPPNPFVLRNGALSRALRLPDGRVGDAVRGLALFEGKAGCSASACHPPGHFAADQSPETRGAEHRVGTPLALPLRLELQEAGEGPLPPPSLTGIWDEWPLLASGAAGFEIRGDAALPAHPFALRRVLEFPARGGRHGNADALTAEERDDLLAYLMSL